LSPLGKRIIVLFMGWVLLVMVVTQVYDNVTGRNAPQNRVIVVPTPGPTVGPDADITRMAELQTCVAADPDNLDCVRELAALYYKLGQYEQAQANYEQAARLAPHDYDILVKLAGTYIFQLMFEEAVDTLRDAVGLKPDSPEIHLLLGLALSKLEPPRLEEAKAEWQQVINLAPDTEWAAQAAELINAANSQR
jgi:tetratricopeptide (TPR) repeat protein